MLTGYEVILNPAPAVPLPQEIYKKVTHLILNESEACILSGREPADLSQQDCCTIGDAFVQYGVQYVVITLGAKVCSMEPDCFPRFPFYDCNLAARGMVRARADMATGGVFSLVDR